jgi:hypothetical protein
VSLVSSLLASAAGQRGSPPTDPRRGGPQTPGALSAEMVRCMRELGVVKVCVSVCLCVCAIVVYLSVFYLEVVAVLFSFNALDQGTQKLGVVKVCGCVCVCVPVYAYVRLCMCLCGCFLGRKRSDFLCQKVGSMHLGLAAGPCVRV